MVVSELFVINSEALGRMLITVFTPTYNRAEMLKRTFESLCSQTFKDFEWLIVDDGSSDNTTEVVNSFIAKAFFPIRYIKKENGGKHTAHNLAVSEARGELFFTVDSDDWIPAQSLHLIASRFKSYSQCKQVIGEIALKDYPDGQLIGRSFSRDNYFSSLSELELKGEKGERSLVFKTNALRNYPFQVLEGERFMPEGVIYDKIDADYSFLVSNDVLTTCEYQPDGLSSNPHRLMVRNPGGYVTYYSQRIDSAYSWKLRIGYAVRYNAFKMLYRGDLSKIQYQGKHHLLCLLCLPLGYIASRLYIRRSNK